MLLGVVLGLVGCQPPAESGDASAEIGSHFFELAAEDFLQVVVVQDDVDVALEWIDPRGERLARIDSPTGRYGPEELVAVAAEPGRHRLATGRTTRRASSSVKDPKGAALGLTPLLETWHDLGLRRRQADTLAQLCRAERRIGDLDSAVEACERATTWYRVLGARRRLAVTLQNGGFAHLERGDNPRAVSALQEALALFQEQKNTRGINVTRSRLGVAYQRLGRIEDALELQRQALAESRRTGDEKTEALALTEMAGALRSLHRPLEALEHLRKAKRIYERLEETRSLATVTVGMAEAALRTGDLELAASAARQAVEIRHALGDSHSEAAALHTLGQVLQRAGDVEAARRAFEDGLGLVKESGDLRSQAFLLVGLAYLHAEKSEPRRALELYDEALVLFEQTPDAAGRATCQARSAEALRDLGRLEEAWERVADALDEVEALHGATSRSDFRLSYFALRQDYFEVALDVLTRFHDQKPHAGWDERAVAVNDRRLARELLESLRLAGPQRHAAVDPVLAADERRLEQELRELAAALEKARRRGGEDVELREKQAAALVARLYEVRGKIRRQIEKERGEEPAKLPELDLDAVRAALDDDTLVLLYALGEESSHLWALSRRRLDLHRLPPRDEIEPLVRQLNAGIRSLWDADEVRSSGRRLGSLLLGPVEDRLKESSHLVVVDDGELRTLPLVALPAPGGDRFLIETHEVSRLPSLSTLLALRRRNATRRETTRIALFADPVFTRDDPRLGGPEPAASAAEDPRVGADLLRAGDALGTEPWRRLLHSRAEADAIRDLWGADRTSMAMGFEASRERLLELETAEHGVLHFATHAVLLPEAELSGLVLSLLDSTGRPRDGYLRAFEISRLDLPVELVVLSACQTGRGRQVRGEGPLGLVWSFLQAGAARVVATRWPVRDEPTARLMRRFYIGLREGRPPSAALREAQLSLLSEPGSRPFDWAGFFFLGEWRPLDGTQPRDFSGPQKEMTSDE